MAALQATWHPTGRLLFWSAWGTVEEAIAAELPELADAVVAAEPVQVADPASPARRATVRAVSVPALAAASVLPAVAAAPEVSDVLRCWAMASRLALEFAARQAVVPAVHDGVATWRAHVGRPEDRQRLDAVARALPPVGRGVPTRERGAIRLQPSAVVVRGFVDAVIDALYRQGAWPGPARSWALELADALRGDDATFQPREARWHGLPAALAAWSADGAGALRLALRLVSPRGASAAFHLHLGLRPHDRPDVFIPLDDAWTAGDAVRAAGGSWPNPRWAVVRGLARAQRVYPPLQRCLAGAAPTPLTLSPDEVWSFLQRGVGPLRDAGVHVTLPEHFEEASGQRLRARMRLHAPDAFHADGEVPYTWEIGVGDTALTGDELRALTVDTPVQRFRGAWILLDPSELARLPAGVGREGRLDGVSALRAVLTGEHEGVEVIADDRLAVLVAALRDPPPVPPPAGLHATLRPYQRRGLSWLASLGELGLGACLADDMGLGKTLQVLAYLLHRRRAAPDTPRPPALVVCPTSLLTNWDREAARFTPTLRVARYHGAHRDLPAVDAADIVLTTYGVLVRDAELLAAQAFDVVVLDEAQAIKNPTSRRARAATGLRARHRVAMTGTPVENRLDELWSLMRFLVPGLLGSRAAFQRSVAVPVERLGDEAAARRLRLGTAPFMLRRVKSDPTVAPDLPEKVERRVWCGLVPEQAALYQEVAEDRLARVAACSGANRRGQVLAMLTALKQVCNHPAQLLKQPKADPVRSGKLTRTVELLRTILDAGERAVLFTQYREMGELLIDALAPMLGGPPPFLHGGLAVSERDAMVQRFQRDPDASPLLLVSLRAGGVGLNLTRASHVIHFDRWWNPAVEDQATDRAYRIGQAENVLVHKLVCQGTLEERIDALLEDKRVLAESVIGGADGLVTQLDDDALRSLVLLGDDAVVEDE